MEKSRLVEKFVEKLKRWVELERKEEIETMRREMKSISGRKRESLGRAILNLSGKVLGEELGYTLVKYGREKEFKNLQISVGDLVVISRGDPCKSDLVATVSEVGKRYIVVAFDKPPPNWALKKVRIDLYANDITFRRQLENLQNLNEQGIKVLEFALGLREPSESEEESIEFLDRKLNDSQEKAVALSLGSRDFFLIHGPFGSGKTRVLVEIVLQEVKRGRKVLVCAESNVAVDNLVERLVGKVSLVRIGHPSRVSRKLKEATLARQVEAHRKFEKVRSLRAKVEELLRERDSYTRPTPKWRRGLSDVEIVRLARKGKKARGVSRKKIREMARWIILNERVKRLHEEVERVQGEIVEEILKRSEVILTTNSSAGLEILKNLALDTVVVDESTQATIPSVLIPLSKGKKFILAGDHKQLPPTILSEKAKGLEKTLFEILIERFPGNSALLRVQYRMNEKLMEFPNETFYGGKIIAANSVSKITLKDLLPNVESRIKAFDELVRKILSPENVLVFVDTARRKDRREVRRKGSTSRENPLEARIVKSLCESLISLGVKEEWIGVITPYDDQVERLKRVFGEELEGVEVSSVDAYQGREKEIIVISFVRSNPSGEIGFLNDLRRLNTSLTRAKRKLIMVGDSSTLSSHPVYERLIEFVKKRGTYLLW